MAKRKIRKPAPKQKVTGYEPVDKISYRLLLKCGHTILVGTPVDRKRLPPLPKHRPCYTCANQAAKEAKRASKGTKKRHKAR